METETYLCPGCDQEVRVGSRRCPHCHPVPKRRRPKASAARARPGRENDEGRDGLNLPDEDFDYEDFVAREFGGNSRRTAGIKWYWWATAVLVIALIVFAGFQLAGWGMNVWR